MQDPAVQLAKIGKAGGMFYNVMLDTQWVTENLSSLGEARRYKRVHGVLSDKFRQC